METNKVNPISMTMFVDFACQNGLQRFATVREAVRTDRQYADFYRPLLEAIVAMHRDQKPVSELDHLLAGLQDDRRRRIYPGIVAGYRKFLEEIGPAQWLEPSRPRYPIGELVLDINPEIALFAQNRTYLLKLWMRGEPLSKKRIGMTLELMREALRDTSWTRGRDRSGWDPIVGLLDVRKARIHAMKEASPRLGLVLRGEAAAFQAIAAAAPPPWRTS